MKNTLRARGESNRVPPGSDPPTSRGPNHFANPAPEPHLLSGFLCTANTGPGRAVRVNCRPSRKTPLFKILDAQYPKTQLFRRFSRKNILRTRGESNRVPPGSDPPTSRGPNHYANPAPEPRLLSGFLCTGNAGPGRAVGVNCRPSRKPRLFKLFDA